MCLMCVEIQKDRMKLNEVVRALKELTIPKEHEAELYSTITTKFPIMDVMEALIEQAAKGKKAS